MEKISSQEAVSRGNLEVLSSSLLAVEKPEAWVKLPLLVAKRSLKTKEKQVLQASSFRADKTGTNSSNKINQRRQLPKKKN